MNQMEYQSLAADNKRQALEFEVDADGALVDANESGLPREERTRRMAKHAHLRMLAEFHNRNADKAWEAAQSPSVVFSTRVWLCGEAGVLNRGGTVITYTCYEEFITAVMRIYLPRRLHVICTRDTLERLADGMYASRMQTMYPPEIMVHVHDS
jgi:hypothetical protein